MPRRLMYPRFTMPLLSALAALAASAHAEERSFSITLDGTTYSGSVALADDGTISVTDYGNLTEDQQDRVDDAVEAHNGRVAEANDSFDGLDTSSREEAETSIEAARDDADASRDAAQAEAEAAAAEVGDAVGAAADAAGVSGGDGIGSGEGPGDGEGPGGGDGPGGEGGPGGARG